MGSEMPFVDRDKEADRRLANKIKRQQQVKRRLKKEDISTVTNRYVGQSTLSNTTRSKKLSDW